MARRTNPLLPELTTDPGRDCDLCPRLRNFILSNRTQEPDWHNAPVPSFTASNPGLLIVGLAPGLRGANRTGRPFTGDWAGDLLYETLLDFGFANGNYDERPDDGLTLEGCMITNAVRCVPPQNKPTPAEIKTCRTFLSNIIVHEKSLTSVLALGRIAHESLVRACGLKPAHYPFGHGASFPITLEDGRKLTLFDSYHCSRYNTNTGVLTRKMFRDVFKALRRHIDTQARSSQTSKAKISSTKF